MSFRRGRPQDVAESFGNTNLEYPKGHHPSSELLLRKLLKSAMEQKANECPTTTSPQKHMKNRSKSTEEMQQTKKAFSSQKSLPGRPELDKVKECPDGSDTPSASTEELK